MRTLAVVILAAASLGAQTPVAEQKPQDDKAQLPSKATSSKGVTGSQMWMENARVLTDETLKDAGTLGSYREAIVKAQLAKLWWKADPTRAKKLLAGAISDVNRRPMNEATDSAIERMSSAVSVAEVSAKLDEKATDALLSDILDQLPDLFSRADKDQKNLLGVVIQRLGFFWRSADHRDVQQVAKIARVLMRTDSTYAGLSVWQALEGIYADDSQLGDKLFSELLDLVDQGRVEPFAISNMGILLFPEVKTADSAKIGDAVRQHYFNTAFAAVLRAQTNGYTKEDCDQAMMFTSVLKNFPEEQQAQMKPIFDRCLATEKQSDQDPAQIELAGLDSVDDLLNAANQTSDLKKRAMYKYWAAAKSFNNEPEKGLDIFNGMPEDERNALPSYEGTMRNELEIKVISRLVKKKDYPALQRVIDDSFDPAVTALHVAASASRAGDNGYATTLLPQVRKFLERKPVENPRFYTELVGTFARLARPEAPIVLTESLKALGTFPEVNPEETQRSEAKSDGKFHFSSFWSSLFPAPFPDLLDVMDQRIMRMQIDDLKYTGERASMRLWLLQSELKAYDEAVKKERGTKEGSPKAPATSAERP